MVCWVFRTGGGDPSGGGGHWHAGKPGKKESITAVLLASYPAEAAGLSPESSRSALTLGLQHSCPCNLGSSDPFVEPSEWLQRHGFLSSSQSPSHPSSLPVWVGPPLPCDSGECGPSSRLNPDGSEAAILAPFSSAVPCLEQVVWDPGWKRSHEGKLAQESIHRTYVEHV